MRALTKRLPKLARTAWCWLREWSGDAAYERYLHSATCLRRHEPELSASEFYVQQLERRYSRPSRCC